MSLLLLFRGAATTAIEVNCQSGALSLTGSSATVFVTPVMTGQSGTLSLSGTSATLGVSPVANCQPGMFLLGMPDATIQINIATVCQPGQLRLVGSAITVEVPGAQPAPQQASAYIGGGGESEDDWLEQDIENDDMEIIALSMEFLARAA